MIICNSWKKRVFFHVQWSLLGRLRYKVDLPSVHRIFIHLCNNVGVGVFPAPFLHDNSLGSGDEFCITSIRYKPGKEFVCKNWNILVLSLKINPKKAKINKQKNQNKITSLKITDFLTFEMKQYSFILHITLKSFNYCFTTFGTGTYENKDLSNIYIM